MTGSIERPDEGAGREHPLATLLAAAFSVGQSAEDVRVLALGEARLDALHQPVGERVVLRARSACDLGLHAGTLVAAGRASYLRNVELHFVSPRLAELDALEARLRSA